MLCPVAVSVCSVGTVWVFLWLGLAPLPFYDKVPRIRLQHGCIESQEYEDADVYLLPFLLGVQYVESLKDVHNAKDDHSVSNGVVVDVPIKPVLVILLRPQKQGKHLKRKIYPPLPTTLRYRMLCI